MKLIHTITVVALSASLGACIVAPHRPYYAQEQTPVANANAHAPIAVNPVYIQPSYPQPAYGYSWALNPFYGWGWRHHSHGWHRGWRR